MGGFIASPCPGAGAKWVEIHGLIFILTGQYVKKNVEYSSADFSLTLNTDSGFLKLTGQYKKNY